MARPPKFNYDNDDFYDEILALSMQGLTDAEIADALSDKFGVSLSPERFYCMKNGNYEAWNKEENRRRGERLCKVLARGRRKVNSIVRGRYLKAALGGIKTKNTTKRYVQDKCVCEGIDRKCPHCGGTGWVIITDKAVMQETECELAPNMQALATWLYHHDPEWRKIERNKDEDADNIPADIDKGIDIDEWIKDKIN